MSARRPRPAPPERSHAPRKTLRWVLLLLTVSMVALVFVAVAIVRNAMPRSVEGVVDGNTLRIEGESVPVRVAGLWVPKPGQCGSDAVRAAMQEHAEGQLVQIRPVPGRDDRDTDGALLREVKIVSGTDIGWDQLTRGWARVRNAPDNVRQEYEAAEQVARKNRRGIWASCTYK